MVPSLYVHVPFCMSRCAYCDFHSSAPDRASLSAIAPRWLDAIERHLAELSRRFDFPAFSTIYIGGGTPSFLPPAIMAAALSAIARSCRAGLAGATEWSVEANPEDIGPDFLSLLAAHGVNRLSVGVQSLEDKARVVAGRRGSARSTMQVLDLLAARWPGRRSADLMYGLASQTAAGLADDVRALVDRGFGHISLYELTLEEGTPLERNARAGLVVLPDDDERADQYDAACEALLAAGYRHYEVSNWAVPGQECLHNMRYWNMDDWLALGPSGVGNVAAGRGRFLRLENTADDMCYYDDPSGSMREVVISGIDAMFESLMMALRTACGLDIAGFRERFGHDAIEAFGPLHELFPESIGLEAGSWRATPRGMDTLNRVLVQAMSNIERLRNRYTTSDEETR